MDEDATENVIGSEISAEANFVLLNFFYAWEPHCNTIRSRSRTGQAEFVKFGKLAAWLGRAVALS